jgi:hypothetical protein
VVTSRLALRSASAQLSTHSGVAAGRDALSTMAAEQPTTLVQAGLTNR